jgi:hypothetical protein
LFAFREADPEALRAAAWIVRSGLLELTVGSIASPE